MAELPVPKIRVAKLHPLRRPAALLRIDPPPATRALGLVLDRSDSWAGLPAALDQLPRLIADLPDDWPVWIWNLSSPEPKSFRELLTSADLKSRKLRISPEPLATGSLLRPVLESIERLRQSQSIPNFLVLVLTDGQLLDARRQTLPPGIRLAGFALDGAAGKGPHWRRVLDDAPLIQDTHRTLCDALQLRPRANFLPFEIRHPRADSLRELRYVSPTQSELLPAESTFVLKSQPLYLVAPDLPTDAIDWALTARSLDRDTPPFAIQATMGSIERDVVTTAETLLDAETVPRSARVADTKASAPEIDEHRQLAEAAQATQAQLPLPATSPTTTPPTLPATLPVSTSPAETAIEPGAQRALSLPLSIDADLLTLAAQWIIDESVPLVRITSSDEIQFGDER